MSALRRWWHRLRFTDCNVCGGEFRKGRGCGMTRRTVCSDDCWEQAWTDYLERAFR